MYFLKVINSLPGKLSKYNRFFSSAFKALTKKTVCTKGTSFYFLQRSRCLGQKKPFVQKEHALIFFSIQGTYEKNHLYKSKVHLFSLAFKALTKKITCVPKVQM